MLLIEIASGDRKQHGLIIIEAVIDYQVTRCRLVNKSEIPVVISVNSPIYIDKIFHRHEMAKFIGLLEPYNIWNCDTRC